MEKKIYVRPQRSIDWLIFVFFVTWWRCMRPHLFWDNRAPTPNPAREAIRPTYVVKAFFLMRNCNP